MLPGNPLLDIAVLKILLVEVKELLGVVEALEVGEDGRALHDGMAALVVVDENGNSTVGTQLGEPGLLLGVLHDVDGLDGIVQSICFLELFKKNVNLVAVGRSPCQQLEARLGHESRGLRRVRHVAMVDLR